MKRATVSSPTEGLPCFMGSGGWKLTPCGEVVIGAEAMVDSSSSDVYEIGCIFSEEVG